MTKLVDNSQRDINEAINYWEHAEGNRFDFCVKASEIVGKYDMGATKKLADGIERSISTVQNCASVGDLWVAMPPRQAEDYRDAVKFSFWLLLAPLWKANIIDMEMVFHWMDEKIKNNWSVDQMRAKLPTRGNKSVWKTSARRFLNTTKEFMEAELINAPALDVDANKYKKALRALVLARGRIEKCIS